MSDNPSENAETGSAIGGSVLLGITLALGVVGGIVLGSVVGKIGADLVDSAVRNFKSNASKSDGFAFSSEGGQLANATAFFGGELALRARGFKAGDDDKRIKTHFFNITW